MYHVHALRGERPPRFVKEKSSRQKTWPFPVLAASVKAVNASVEGEERECIDVSLASSVLFFLLLFEIAPGFRPL